jgi:pyruvate,water dikinase
MSQVVSLQKALELDIARVGGKALHLAELDAAGFRVPPAFVVTTDAFIEHFQRAGAGAMLESYATPDRIQLAMLRDHQLNPELVAEIASAQEALAQRIGGTHDAELLCAVRSSGAEEDSATASFAGQHATYYYTRAQDIPQRIVDCWLSCWTAQAAAYRAANDENTPRMAVLIQQMVRSHVSGVTFTRDPTEPVSERLVIESCWGLGAALVDGRVTPDRYRLRRIDHRLVSAKIGTKRFKVTEDLIDPEGTRLEAIPRHLQRRETLEPEMLQRVAALGADCETHFRAPQDVEWAIADGELYLLQSRPITTVVPLESPVEGRWVVFKPIVENFTEAMTPLTIDLVRRVIPRFGQFIDGRFYINFNMIKALVPLDISDAQLADLSLMRPRVDEDAPRFDRRRSWLPLLVVLMGYLSWGTLMVRTRHLPARALAGFKVRCATVLADDRLDALSATRRLFQGASPFAPAGHLAFQVNISSVRYFFLIQALRALLARFAPDFDPNLIGSLCAGSTDMLSTQLIEDLRSVAELAGSNATVRRLFAEEPAETLSTRLAAEPEARTFIDGLDAFLARFGHRGTREMELAAPRWLEDPTPLLGMISNMLEAVPSRDDRGAAQRALAHRALAEALPNRMARRIADWLIRRIRYYATLRENTRHFHVMALTTIRQKILELERELISTGALKCPDDIFYLTWDEISALRAGHSDRRDASVLIRNRRIHHTRVSERMPPSTFNIELDPADTDATDLSGHCASPGTAEGIARLVLDPSTDAALRPGEILVAPYTDPAWTPLFLNAAAVIVEVGSYLSHAGTVAREYGVPCVVDVHGCMERLVNGQHLRVDASNGRIQVLSQPAEPATEPAL